MAVIAKFQESEPLEAQDEPLALVEPPTYGPPPFRPFEDIRALFREWQEVCKDLGRSGK